MRPRAHWVGAGLAAGLAFGSVGLSFVSWVSSSAALATLAAVVGVLAAGESLDLLVQRGRTSASRIGAAATLAIGAGVAAGAAAAFVGLMTGWLRF